MREVKRKAKVGEYIKIVDKYGNDKSYKNGDILKIVDDCLIGCWVETPTDNHVAIFDKEYVVLEDYNPNKFKVDDYDSLSYDFSLTDDQQVEYVKIVDKQDTLIEEEDNMNKVLELWKNRKLAKLRKEYEKGEKEYREKIDIVKKYKQLVEQFERDMQDLYIMDEEHKYIKQRNEQSFCPYYLDNKYISDEYRELKGEEYTNKEKEIRDTVEEVEAQLSLSDDLEYQKEVLINYGILDRKTGKINVD